MTLILLLYLLTALHPFTPTLGPRIYHYLTTRLLKLPYAGPMFSIASELHTKYVVACIRYYKNDAPAVIGAKVIDTKWSSVNSELHLSVRFTDIVPGHPSFVALYYLLLTGTGYVDWAKVHGILVAGYNDEGAPRNIGDTMQWSQDNPPSLQDWLTHYNKHLAAIQGRDNYINLDHLEFVIVFSRDISRRYK